MSSLADTLVRGGPFQGYTYAYPHKTAYRRLDPPVPLRTAWEKEDRNALFLYVHVPFCEMRCGFCNLFTTTRAPGARMERYLEALRRQAAVLASALGSAARFARLAVGGGTPTLLPLAQLESLFRLVQTELGCRVGNLPTALEASPATVRLEVVDWLRAQNVSRVSLGVQSFFEVETRALGRPQSPREVHQALAQLASAGFPCLNVDLIYGIPGQTVASWRASLEQALEYSPQEIYLYPLYVRPLTGLARRGPSAEDTRLTLYRAGRDLLKARGYRAVSMRLFRAVNYRPPEGPVYCCQDDGMVGLGAGARSYTRALHYSTEFAVGRAGVEAILDDFTQRPVEAFAEAHHGCWLDSDEQRRRYVLKSLLRVEGLDRSAYRERFGTDVLDDRPELHELLESHQAVVTAETLQLTETGMEHSDVIGPWLASDAMTLRMAEYEPR